MSANCDIIRFADAGIAHPVERHLAKVEVASSSLVARSTKACCYSNRLLSFPYNCGHDEIGRHARFRFLCRKALGFKSPCPHQPPRGRISGLLGVGLYGDLNHVRTGRRPVHEPVQTLANSMIFCDSRKQKMQASPHARTKPKNPNPSPIGKIWFGFCWSGAGGGTRTHTLSPAADFESATSTIPSHRHVLEKYITSQVKIQEAIALSFRFHPPVPQA